MGEKEELLELLSKIKDDKLLVIVEGIKDRRALNHYGIKRVITLSRKPIYKIIESVADREVIILTDLDKKGKELYQKLNSKLSQRAVYVNNELRHFLFKNTKLRQIEGLKNYLEKLK